MEKGIVLAESESVPAAFQAKDFEIASAEFSARRKAITEYIAKNLKEGEDYGIIGNFPKKCLFKPGAEKFAQLMNLRATFDRDDKTLEMIPEVMKKDGVIAYVCMLVTQAGHPVAEGRGACSVAEKKGQINTAIKIAEKRAMVDACLRAFSISDSFTQDIDDMSGPSFSELILEAKRLYAEMPKEKKTDATDLWIAQIDVHTEKSIRDAITRMKGGK